MPDAQRFREEVEVMSDDELIAAHDAGELDELLAGRDHPQASEDEPGANPTASTGSADLGARGGTIPGQIHDVAVLRQMSPSEVVKAHQEGRLDDLLAGRA